MKGRERNRARRLTLLGLVLVVFAFGATLLALPASNEARHVSRPASLFLVGLGNYHRCLEYDRASNDSGGGIYSSSGGIYSSQYDTGCARYERVELAALRTRVIVVYSGAAALILLIGVAFGAARRERQEIDGSALSV